MALAGTEVVPGQGTAQASLERQDTGWLEREGHRLHRQEAQSGASEADHKLDLLGELWGHCSFPAISCKRKAALATVLWTQG